MLIDTLLSLWHKITEGLAWVILALGLLLLARITFQKCFRYDLKHLVLEEKNSACALVTGSFFLAYALTLKAILWGQFTAAPVTQIAHDTIEGLLTLGLLLATIWLNDRCILHRFSIRKEIVEDQNLGTAFVVSASILCSGLILQGALTGYSASFLTGLRDTVIFWLLGQALLIFGGILFQKITAYDIHRFIEEDNAAVGLDFAGFLIGIGCITQYSLKQANGQNLGSEIVATLLSALLGIGLYLLVRRLVRFIILPQPEFNEPSAVHNNLAISILTATLSTSTALILIHLVQR